MRKGLLLLTGMLFLLLHTAVAQTSDITGRVTDDKGNAVQGASSQGL